MPDLIDQLVDAQTENDAADLAEITSNKMSDEDKELVDSGAMSKSAAEEITNAIKSYATATWVLVKRAHDGKAWKSLGYSTWADYVATEFDMSASRSYQLINQAEVIATLEDAAPDGTKLLLTEAQTRDIKKELPRITEKVKNATANDDPGTAASKINDIVESERAAIKNDSSPTDGDDEPPVQEDSFSQLDQHDPDNDEDHLSVKDSGSAQGALTTGLEDLDLDADVNGDDDEDMNDDDLYSPDSVNDGEADFLYTMQYFGRLKMEMRPDDVMKVYKDDIDNLREQVDALLKWFGDLRKRIG